MKAESIQVKGITALFYAHTLLTFWSNQNVYHKLSCMFFVFSVRAVLKKREYGTKYTQNNFITTVRAMNEFCLKPRYL